MKYLGYILAFLLLCCTRSLSAQQDSILGSQSFEIQEARSFNQQDIERYQLQQDFIYLEKEHKENSLEAWYNRAKAWLNRMLNRGFTNSYFRILLVLAAAIFLVWYILRSEMNHFVQKKNSKEKRSNPVLDIRSSKASLKEKYEEAISKKSYRNAIRFAYLMVLKAMNRKKIIRWKAWKLSEDYQQELSNTAFADSFEQATRYFNYTWYGMREMTSEQFAEAQVHFDSLIHTIEQA